MATAGFELLEYLAMLQGLVMIEYWHSIEQKIVDSYQVRKAADFLFNLLSQ